MSRITQKPSVGALSPWYAATGTSNYTGTATPPGGNQAYGAIPATGPQPASGTGFYDSSFATYVGQKFDTSDGREFVLIQNGAVAVAAASAMQSPAEVTAFEKLAMTVPTAYPATAGTYQVYVTNGATKLNVNQFAQGYLIVAAGTGIGQMLKIASHTAAVATTGKITVTLEDPIQTTLDATSVVSLIANPYIGSVIAVASGSTQTGSPIGIATYALAASTAATYDGTSGALTANGVAQYGMIQTHGPCVGTITSTTTCGYGLGISTTAGALIVQTLTTAPLIAYNMQTQTTAQCGMVYLNL